MNATAQAVIDAGLAALTRAMDAPVEPFGFGSDLSCDSDLDPNMAEVDGFSMLALGQALVRRLDCPRGALPDDPDYGISLVSFLNRGITDQELRRLSGKTQNEIAKDDRVDVVTAVVTFTDSTNAMTVSLNITPVDPRIGGFRLTLAVTSGGVVLAAIEEAA